MPSWLSLPSGVRFSRQLQANPIFAADLTRGGWGFRRIDTRCGTRRGPAAAILAALLMLPSAIAAPGLSAPALAKVVDAHYNHLTSLQVRFTERYRGMGMDRTESGTLTLRKPGRMRWAYDAPAGKLFLLNGKDAISYTPGDAQADRLPARQLDDLRSPLRFLLGHTELAKELDHLSVAPIENNLFSLAGTPHPANAATQRLRQVTLVVDTHGLIHSLQIDEVDGAITTFTFTDAHENIPTQDSDFTFTRPPGVTVVDSASPMD